MPPIYEYVCPVCGGKRDEFRAIANRNDPEICCVDMERVITAPAMVMDDIAPYRSMATGEMITSRSRHREHLKDHGMIEVGNETVKPKPLTPPGLKETIIEIAAEKLRHT